MRALHSIQAILPRLLDEAFHERTEKRIPAVLGEALASHGAVW